MRARWGELSARCGVACRSDTARGKANRKRWGCDRPAEGDGWGIRCWRCQSHGRSAECSVCGGKGHVAFTRCPAHYITNDIGVVLDAVRLDMEHGVLPVPGGILAQSHAYTHVRAIVRGEWAACESRSMDDSE